MQAQCADKFAVREFVRERVGEEILNELIGVYDNVDEINMDQLPDSFVLKATHGSMMNIICKDKRALDWPAAQEKMRRWMRCNYYWVERERWYRGIRPRIICEKYLEDPVTRDLRDYKMLCFDGEVKYIWVDIDRFTLHRRNFYDTNWKYKAVGMTFPNAPDVQIERPERLSRLIEVASLLSRGFPHVRVDLYYLENKNIIFGEMTFCAGGGWEPFSSRAFAEELGGYIKLPIQTGR